MAKHIKEFHTCDVCGAEIARPYSGGERGTYAMKISVDVAVAGYGHSWTEVCEPCNWWLGDKIHAIEEEMKLRRAASAQGGAK